MNNIVVVYKFSLNQGISTEQFIKASKKIDALIVDMSGFLYRSVTQIDADNWLTIAYWESQSALDKSQYIVENLDFTAFMGMINVETISKIVADVHTSVMPEMKAA